MAKIETQDDEVVVEKIIDRWGRISGLLEYAGRKAKIVVISQSDDKGS